MCSVYGFSGKTDGVLACKEGVNSRTLSCQAGYNVVGAGTQSITLTGPIPFSGCQDIDECAIYGYSGREATAASCSNGVNQR